MNLVLSLFISPLSTHALPPLPNPNQAQIDELLRQIAMLQEQIRLLQGGQTNTWCHTFNINLGVGARSTEVSFLQMALGKSSFSEGHDDSAQPNQIRSYTEALAGDVSAFQLKYKSEILTPNGLTSPTGYVGPATRAKLNQLYGCRPVTGNQPPVISGVSGPTTLRVGETGTWTVRASDPENGTLNYSVFWGDELTNYPNSNTLPAITTPVQQSATFTHIYSTAIPHYPRFIVTDNSGQSVQTSLSVVVGQNSNSPITVTSPNGGEQWYANSVRPITWSYTGATSATKVDLYLDHYNPPCPASTQFCDYVIFPSYVLDKNIPAQSSYNWIVATDIVNNIITPSTYKVRVCEAGSQTNCDSSDNYFTILFVATQ